MLRWFSWMLMVVCCPSLLAGEEIASAISPATRDKDGILVHEVQSGFQSADTKIRVLLPDNLPAGERRPVIYVLPVEGGDGERYGNGLREIQKRNLHNRSGAIFVAPTFSALPWYADHATDPAIRQEMYFVQVVVPYIDNAYPVEKSAEGRMLLGFSKSGWGAWTLLMRHPKTFGSAVAWDAPLAMQQLGKYGTSGIYGTQAQFEKYRVTDLLKASSLSQQHRLILLGYGSFRNEHEEVHRLMTELKIPHEYRDGPQRKHDWHSGWVAEAVQLLIPETKVSP